MDAGTGRAARDGASVDSLAQQAPFRFVTDARRDGDRLLGRWAINGREPFLAGHFPGDPIVPGVLIGESLAQLASLAMHDAVIASTNDATVASMNEAAVAPSPAETRASVTLEGAVHARALAPPLLVAVDLRFRSVVRPPAELQLEAHLERSIGSLAEFEVTARQGDRLVADGRVSLRAPTGRGA